MRNKYKLKYLITFLLLFISELSINNAQRLNTDFLNMKGIKVSHTLHNDEDSLSVKQIIELREENGVPVWFGRDIKKVVCLSGICRIVHLWLFWNGIGDYLGFQLNKNEPLTKTDHIEFEQDDYQKLNHILADSLSVLKNLKETDLVSEVKESNKIDAHTGATQLSFKDDLVENAAYTCYSLWHTVYGSTRNEILNILEKRSDSVYLKLLLNNKNIDYQKWAVSQIIKNPDYQQSFNSQILAMLQCPDNELAKQALDYLSSDLLSKPNMQQNLFVVFDKVNLQRKFQIVFKLSLLQKLDDKVVLFLLNEFNKQKLTISMLTYIYKPINSENLKNKEILQQLNIFQKNENMFVRNLTQKLLSEATSNKKIL